jgi:hypothetical protein
MYGQLKIEFLLFKIDYRHTIIKENHYPLYLNSKKQIFIMFIIHFIL